MSVELKQWHSFFAGMRTGRKLTLVVNSMQELKPSVPAPPEIKAIALDIFLTGLGIIKLSTGRPIIAMAHRDQNIAHFKLMYGSSILIDAIACDKHSSLGQSARIWNAFFDRYLQLIATGKIAPSLGQGAEACCPPWTLAVCWQCYRWLSIMEKQEVENILELMSDFHATGRQPSRQFALLDEIGLGESTVRIPRVRSRQMDSPDGTGNDEVLTTDTYPHYTPNAE
jgi:hypothetical protein